MLRSGSPSPFEHISDCRPPSPQGRISLTKLQASQSCVIRESLLVSCRWFFRSVLAQSSYCLLCRLFLRTLIPVGRPSYTLLTYHNHYYHPPRALDAFSCPDSTLSQYLDLWRGRRQPPDFQEAKLSRTADALDFAPPIIRIDRVRLLLDSEPGSHRYPAHPRLEAPLSLRRHSLRSAVPCLKVDLELPYYS